MPLSLFCGGGGLSLSVPLARTLGAVRAANVFCSHTFCYHLPCHQDPVSTVTADVITSVPVAMKTVEILITVVTTNADGDDVYAVPLDVTKILAQVADKVPNFDKNQEVVVRTMTVEEAPRRAAGPASTFARPLINRRTYAHSNSSCEDLGPTRCTSKLHCPFILKRTISLQNVHAI